MRVPSTSSDSIRATENAPRVTSPTLCSFASSSERQAPSATCGARGADHWSSVPGRKSVAGRAAASSTATSRLATSTASTSGRHDRGRANGSRVPPPAWQQSRIVTTCGPRAATSAISRASSLSARARRSLPPTRRPQSWSRIVCNRPVDSARAERGGCRLLAAVPEEREQRHVARAGRAEVVAEGRGDGVARRLAVLQHERSQLVARPRLEVGLEGGHVVATPEQRVDRRVVGVDRDEEGVDRHRVTVGREMAVGMPQETPGSTSGGASSTTHTRECTGSASPADTPTPSTRSR